MASNSSFKVFVFSKTAGYRHESIPAGIASIKRLSETSNLFTVDASEDATLITFSNLVQYSVLVFLHTSGDFLTREQLAELRKYVNNGGGFVAIHGASSAMKQEPWYGQLIGAVFTEHPEPQSGDVHLADCEHVITSSTPKLWKWFDEWYNFTETPKGVNVLLTVDEGTYSGGKHGNPHPIAWCHEFDGGRSFYTALGHFDAAYEDEIIMSHILNGILWAAKKA
ncbi:secreted glycosyl hydrolase [Xylariales sp. PMI_506]|nr:secreted glycosyl hydrolase [Xylariales sp. PMI_506]